MHKIIISVLFMMVWIGCADIETASTIGLSEIEKAELKSEIDSLSTIEKQQQFLIEIYNLDQGVRNHIHDQEQRFGAQSTEVEKAYHAMREADQVNLFKITSYLDTYGYPAIQDHGKEACGAPFIVIHHMTQPSSLQNDFKYLYKGYLKGAVEIDRMNFFMNRAYYNQTNGKRIDWGRPYRSEEEFDTLIKVLELDPVILSGNF